MIDYDGKYVSMRGCVMNNIEITLHFHPDLNDISFQISLAGEGILHHIWKCVIKYWSYVM